MVQARIRGALWLYVVAGVLAGALYAAANTMFDIWDRSKPLVSTLASIHGFVDRGIPLFAGGLLGVAFHYWGLRTELAKREASRAEALGQRLQKVERDQAVWIVATSTLHEVRNPLHNLGLLLDEALEQGDVDPGEPARRQLLDRVRAQVGRIDASIQGLRRLTTSAKPTLRAVPVTEIVNEVIAAARARPPEPRGISFSAETRGGLAAHGDSNFLRIILENLVQNSVDTVGTSDAVEGRVHVEVTSSGRDAIVRVADNGPGVSPELRSSVFEPLTTTKGAEGMGLGLAIARALARAMGGDVSFVDVPGWSTCVELRLQGEP